MTARASRRATGRVTPKGTRPARAEGAEARPADAGPTRPPDQLRPDRGIRNGPPPVANHRLRPRGNR